MDQHIILILVAINPFGYFGLILQHFLFDIQPTNPLTFMLTIKPSAMPPQCAPKLCAPQALKGSSPYENYIAIHSSPTPTIIFIKQFRLTPSQKHSSHYNHRYT